MYDVNLKSVEVNETNNIVRVIQSVQNPGSWSLFPTRVYLPGGEDAIVTIDRNTTVAEMNMKLYRAFGFGTYYMGLAVDGTVTPANGSLTMGYLNDNNNVLVVVEDIFFWMTDD